jgi:hypothetical protein
MMANRGGGADLPLPASKDREKWMTSIFGKRFSIPKRAASPMVNQFGITVAIKLICLDSQSRLRAQ